MPGVGTGTRGGRHGRSGVPRAGTGTTRTPGVGTGRGVSRGCPGPYHPKVIDPADLHLRNATYRLLIHLGRAPTAGEVAVAADRTEAEVRDGWQRLHDGHALVLDAAGEISMANPFAARPTPFRVEAAGRSWFANCG